MNLTLSYDKGQIQLNQIIWKFRTGLLVGQYSGLTV